MKRRIDRNAIASQRRVTKEPFNPVFTPDLQPALITKPGFPPDTEGFCVSTFTGRFALMTDFWYKVPNGWLQNTDDGFGTSFADAAQFPNIIAGFQVPTGFRMILQHVFIPRAIPNEVNRGAAQGADFPITMARGVSSNSYSWTSDLGIEIQVNNASIPGYYLADGTSDNNYNGIADRLFSPYSIDLFVRLESNDFLTVNFTPQALPAGGWKLSSEFPTVEFRGQIEAIENRSLPTLGMTTDAIPTSERKGLILDQKKVERK